MNKYISIMIVFVLVLLGVWFFTRSKNKEENIIDSTNQEKNMTATLHTNQ